MEPAIRASGENPILDTSLFQLVSKSICSALLACDHRLYAIIARTLSLRCNDSHIQCRQATRRIGNAS
eukprot:12169446-Karenia_brevis.AAC.1